MALHKSNKTSVKVPTRLPQYDVTFTSLKFGAILRPCSRRWKSQRRSVPLKVLPYQNVVLQAASLNDAVTMDEVSFHIHQCSGELMPLRLTRVSGQKNNNRQERLRNSSADDDDSDQQSISSKSDDEREESAALFFSPPPRGVASPLAARSRRPPIAPKSSSRKRERNVCGDDEEDDGIPAIPISMSPDPDNYDHF